MLRKLIATFYKKGMSVVSLDTLNQVFSIFVHHLTSSNKTILKRAKIKHNWIFLFKRIIISHFDVWDIIRYIRLFFLIFHKHSI